MEKWKNRIREMVPKAKSVWNQYGYYISLACLLTLFGAAAYLYRNGGGTAATEAAILRANQEEAVAALSQTDVGTFSTPEPTVEPSPSFAKPLLGEITREYSPDDLQWNETLSQWRTHAGVDLAAPAGTAVMASERGVVLSAYEDDLLGNVIELGHDGGYVTRYCSLGTLELVSPGETVEKHQAISCVGSSALIEQTDGPHLHFELLQNGTNLPPEFE